MNNHYNFILALIVILSVVYGFQFHSHKQLKSQYSNGIRSLQLNAMEDPLLLRAARGEKVERVPVWMMRQAGRHMQVYRDLCKTVKTFRDRSENADVATEIR